MKPQKQTVYLPVKIEGASGNYIPDNSVLIVKEQREMDKYWENLVKPEKAFVFTPEQLNEYTENVIKQALETAAEKSMVHQHSRDYKVSSKAPVVRQKIMISEVDKQSITNTFEETFKKFEV